MPQPPAALAIFTAFSAAIAVSAIAMMVKTAFE
jgi:hypothetical protein